MSEDKNVKKTNKKKTVKKTVKEEIVDTKKETIDTKKEIKKEVKTYKTKEAIIIMILSMIIGAGVGSVVTHYLDGRNKSKMLEDFNKVYDDVYTNSYKRPSKSEILYSSVTGLLNSLNDRYSYFDNDKMALMNYEHSVEGTFVGLGINVCLCESGKIEIVSVFEDTPAEKIGLKVGDKIVKLDGVDYDINNYNDFSYKLKSSSIGKEFELEILRNDETITKTIELDKIEVPSVTYGLISRNNRNVGHFIINNFADNTLSQFEEKYEQAKKDNIEAIVLDVRNNAEGKFENAEELVSLFLDKDTVLYHLYKNGNYEEVLVKNKKEIDLPVVVVVNGGTMSSGELLASALNENLNAPIVGEKTFGKGYLQKVLPLSNGRIAVFTTNEWVTSKKVKVEEVGITPTYEISKDETQVTDLFLEKAIEILLNNTI